ncbi:hypothetical protein S83_036219, partial [Arachis hypogaea]
KKKIVPGSLMKAVVRLGGDDQVLFLLLIDRYEKVRLTKWYTPCSRKERSK